MELYQVEIEATEFGTVYEYIVAAGSLAEAVQVTVNVFRAENGISAYRIVNSILLGGRVALVAVN